MHKVELIIFDLDGTLIDSRKDIANAVNFTLRKLGLNEKSVQVISSYIGNGVENLLRRVLEEGRLALFEKAMAVFEEYYREHSTEESILYPNTEEVLTYFKDKRKLIITNRRREFAELSLKSLDIYKYFEGIMGGDDLGCMKPSSCSLENAMRIFNITDKKKAIIVGDMDIDIIAGKSAGIITCAVTYGIGKREDIIKADPDYIIDDMIRLKEIIR